MTRTLAALLVVLVVRSGTAIPAPKASHVDALRERAAAARGRGHPEEAEALLLEALEYGPDDAGVLADLLASHADDEDAFELWAERYVASLLDAHGRVKLPLGLDRALRKRLEGALDFARARGEALRDLERRAKRLRDPAGMAEALWLRRVHRALTAGLPGVREEGDDELRDAIQRCNPDPKAWLATLDKEVGRAAAAEEWSAAMEGARILRGLAVQARRAKLALPNALALEAHAVAVMDEARAALAAQETDEPWTVEKLARLDPDGRARFAERHADWTRPAVAVSPRGLYRIESVCGARTTLFAAADVEAHHARLAAWMGADPFAGGPQGEIRLCRSPADAEDEGQPWWWALGWQGGDRTTVYVNFADRLDIAETLTHELTHRFDQRLYPGLPSWAAEGRAVYAETGTLHPRAARIAPDAIDFSRLQDACDSDYDVPEKLESLLAGPAEYRDNYTAGYALWVFLVRYREGFYAAQVGPWLRSHDGTGGTGPVDRFKQFFCDGRGGRSSTLDGLAADFARFVREGRDDQEHEWTRDWFEKTARAMLRERAEAAESDLALQRDDEPPLRGTIHDRSNWPRRRDRLAEPEFGEDHAAAGARWLMARGQSVAAVAAVAWALRVDPADPAAVRSLADDLAAAGEPDGAWLLGARAGAAPTGEPPSGAAACFRLLDPLLARFAAAVAEADAQGRPRTARALRADHDAIARAAGLPERFAAAAERDPPHTEFAPDCLPWTGVLARGAASDAWLPEKAVPGPWFWHQPAEGVLELGRNRAEGAVTGLVRDANIKPVFVRGRDVWRGDYSVRTTVHLVSAFFDAGVVVGHTRADRGVSVRVEGGDWDYAAGHKEDLDPLNRIHVSLDDLRPWNRGLTSQRRTYTHSGRQSFELRVEVSDDLVRVLLDGSEVLAYRSATGEPVDGHVGFFLNAGLIAFERPVVRVHRVLGDAHTCPCGHGDEPIDLQRPCTLDPFNWNGRRVLGLPRDPCGTVLLLFTARNESGGYDPEVAADAIDDWKAEADAAVFVPRLHVALPPPPEGVSPPLPWGGLLPAERVHRHAGLPGLAAQVDEEEREPAWVALDDRNVVRAFGPGSRATPAASELMRRLHAVPAETVTATGGR